MSVYLYWSYDFKKKRENCQIDFLLIFNKSSSWARLRGKRRQCFLFCMMLNKKNINGLQHYQTVSIINEIFFTKTEKMEPTTYTNPSSLGEGPPRVPLGTNTAMPPRKDFLPESSVGFWQRAT